jgi:hypothetical protein
VRGPENPADLVEQAQPFLACAGDLDRGIDVALGEGRRGEGLEGRRARGSTSRYEFLWVLNTLGHGALGAGSTVAPRAVLGGPGD